MRYTLHRHSISPARLLVAADLLAGRLPPRESVRCELRGLDDVGHRYSPVSGSAGP